MEPGGTSYSVFGSFPVAIAGKTGTAERGEGSQTSPGMRRSPRMATRGSSSPQPSSGAGSASSRRRRSSPRSSSATSTPTGEDGVPLDRSYAGVEDGGRSETTDDRAAGPAPCRAAPPPYVDGILLGTSIGLAALSVFVLATATSEEIAGRAGLLRHPPGPVRGRRCGADGRPRAARLHEAVGLAAEHLRDAGRRDRARLARGPPSRLAALDRASPCSASSHPSSPRCSSVRRSPRSPSIG